MTLAGRSRRQVRGRLPALFALPIMLVGSFAARATAAVCFAPGGETRAARALESHSDVAIARTPQSLLTSAGAILAVLVLVWMIPALLGRRQVGLRSPWVFLALSPLAFLAQELVEHVLRQEGRIDGDGFVRLLIGLVLQLPFSLATYLVARALVRVARRLARLLSLAPALVATQLPQLGRLRAGEPRSYPALALGYGERGPPCLSSASS